MNIEIQAAAKTVKRQALMWIAAGLLIFAGLVIDTKGFTKPPSWWKVGIEVGGPASASLNNGASHE